jgi:hypothetical protein
MIDETTVVRRNPSVAYRGLGEEGGGVLLHLATGAYHGVNEVGALVWSLLDDADGTSFGSIMGELRARIEDPPDDLADDIGTFVEDMAARDLVSLAPVSS